VGCVTKQFLAAREKFPYLCTANTYFNWVREKLSWPAKSSSGPKRGGLVIDKIDCRQDYIDFY
jgi:hypothetical protein